jgi:hypothetical protein
VTTVDEPANMTKVFQPVGCLQPASGGAKSATLSLGSLSVPITVAAGSTVRLHFAELYWTAAGKRTFGVAINGTTVLSNFDIYATAGANYKAVVREFTTTANASGQIIVNLTKVTDNASISGIEILR